MVAMSSPSAATLSRSKTSSISGWSILRSMMGGNANMPLVAATCCNCCANDKICSGSAVADRMNSTGKFPPPGSAGGGTIVERMPGDAIGQGLHLRHDLEDGALPFAPRLEHQAAEAVVRKGDLKNLLLFGHLVKLAGERIGVERGLINRCVRRRLDDAHDEALVLRRREFLGLPGHVEHDASAGSTQSR